MPAHVRPVTDERDALLTFLDHQRHLVRTAAYGLTDDEARRAPSASALSVGGVLKHLAQVERSWMKTIRQQRQSVDPSEYVAGFHLTSDETLTGILADYDAAARETSAVLATYDLDDPVPVPRDAAWMPKDVDAWSVRWVVLHLIEETARHAGHADIVRESVDRATSLSLMAAAEGWEMRPWVVPWQRERAQAQR